MIGDKKAVAARWGSRQTLVQSPLFQAIGLRPRLVARWTGMIRAPAQCERQAVVLMALGTEFAEVILGGERGSQHGHRRVYVAVRGRRGTGDTIQARFRVGSGGCVPVPVLLGIRDGTESLHHLLESFAHQGRGELDGNHHTVLRGWPRGSP